MQTEIENLQTLRPQIEAYVHSNAGEPGARRLLERTLALIDAMERRPQTLSTPALRELERQQL